MMTRPTISTDAVPAIHALAGRAARRAITHAQTSLVSEADRDLGACRLAPPLL